MQGPGASRTCPRRGGREERRRRRRRGSEQDAQEHGGGRPLPPGVLACGGAIEVSGVRASGLLGGLARSASHLNWSAQHGRPAGSGVGDDSSGEDPDVDGQ